MLTTKERHGRVWGIVAVTLGINGFLGMYRPVPIVAFLSLPASVLCGGIAFHRGAERLGGTGISLGVIGFLLQSFFLVTASQRLASYKPNPKANLIRSLNEMYSKQLAEGSKRVVPYLSDESYLYSYNEEEAQKTSALTFSLVIHFFGIPDPGSASLRFTRIENKKTNTSKTYKSEVTIAGGSYALVVTDLTNNEVIKKKSPTAGPACEPAQFDSLRACINDGTHKGALQSAANRTCDNQFAELTCCLKDGSTYSGHLIIPPDDQICQLKDVVPTTVLLDPDSARAWHARGKM